jgi:2-dehydro-3-deoxyphosphogluconate aldolase/(4S)-4-hydroxy-2-oxoglutarate aldolase
MQKIRTVQRIVDAGVIVIIRGESSDQAIQVAEACHKGGIVAIEIAFTTPGAEGAIRELARRFRNGEVVLGAGTVLDPETARAAILAGAQYLVSPTLNESTLRLAHRYQVPCLPGAMTVAEVLASLEAGADLVKLFPGELFGPAAIRAIHGPVPQAALVPTGGVNADNVAEWFAAGAVAVGVGSAVTGAAKKGGMRGVTAAAKLLVDKARAARKR